MIESQIWTTIILLLFLRLQLAKLNIENIVDKTLYFTWVNKPSIQGCFLSHPFDLATSETVPSQVHKKWLQ